MKKAAQKMLPPVFWLGVFTSVSSLLWLAIYRTVDTGHATALMGMVLLCIAVQVAAYIGGRKLQNAFLWPGLCMVAAAPATLWSAYIGPNALYGHGWEMLDFSAMTAKPMLYFITVPVFAVGILVCIGWAVVGALTLAVDVLALASGKPAPRAPRPRPKKAAAADAPSAEPPAAEEAASGAAEEAQEAATEDDVTGEDTPEAVVGENTPEEMPVDAADTADAAPEPPDAAPAESEPVPENAGAPTEENSEESAEESAEEQPAEIDAENDDKIDEKLEENGGTP